MTCLMKRDGPNKGRCAHFPNSIPRLVIEPPARFPFLIPTVDIMTFQHFFRSFPLLSLALILTGCGGAPRPEMGYVSGTITMDGQPLHGVIVVMKPENGRMAVAMTDSKGYYDIEYIKGEKGTKLGPTTVSFEWPTSPIGPTKPIPSKYTAAKSEAKLDVKKGRQTFNLDLKSETETAAAQTPQQARARQVPD